MSKQIPGFNQALRTFQFTAKTVPAYRLFLKLNGIDPGKIKTIKDFEEIPFVDKKNYLKKYPFRDLFPYGKIPPMVSASSGSSGQPFYWPRGEDLHEEGADIHARILFDIFGLRQKRTLIITSFSMGMWIAGTYTLSSILAMAKKENTEVVVATPGIEVEDTLFLLQEFAKNFEALVIVGYPPFLMDLVLLAKERKINFRKWDTHFLFAGEQFSETWREYLYDAAGVRSDLSRSVSIYGTADAAIIGHETPATIAFRKNNLIKGSYHTSRIDSIGQAPTLVQYYPEYKYIETIKNELTFTSGRVGIPLVRYNIHDQGTTLSIEEFRSLLKESGTIDRYALDQESLWKLPAIALYGRKDITVMFYALIIYPQNIKSALEEKNIERHITGKFTAEVIIADNKKQKFCLHVELARGEKENKKLEKKLQQQVIKTLRIVNAEYRKLLDSLGKQAYPKIILHQFGSESFRIKKAKHRWVKKVS